MCGRFVITGDPFELGVEDNFNVSPGQNIPIKTLNCDGQLKTWSFSPVWKKDMNLINCRSETMLEKPSFKGAKKCIIPFSGWYEWKNENNIKTPYYFYSNAKYFAGLYNQNGCLIVTAKASPKIKHIHPRQPLLIDEWNLDKWFMDNSLQDNYSLNKINFYEVTNSVNNPKNNTPNLIQEL